MLLHRNMNKLEVKEVDSGYLLVNHGIELAIWVVKHPINEGGIHLNNQGANAYKI